MQHFSNFIDQGNFPQEPHILYPKACKANKKANINKISLSPSGKEEPKEIMRKD